MAIAKRLVGLLLLEAVLFSCGEMATSQQHLGVRRNGKGRLSNPDLERFRPPNHYVPVVSDNFVVWAPSREIAIRIAKRAEELRLSLAQQWTDAALPPWQPPRSFPRSKAWKRYIAENEVPWAIDRPDRLRWSITVHPNQIGTSETRYVYDNRASQKKAPFGLAMVLYGDLEQYLLEHLLVHELTHAILATYYGRDQPPWATEATAMLSEPPQRFAQRMCLLVRLLGQVGWPPLRELLSQKDYDALEGDPRRARYFYARAIALGWFLVERVDAQRDPSDPTGLHLFRDFVGEATEEPANKITFESALERYYADYGLTTVAELEFDLQRWVEQVVKPAVESGQLEQAAGVVLDHRNCSFRESEVTWPSAGSGLATR